MTLLGAKKVVSRIVPGIRIRYVLRLRHHGVDRANLWNTANTVGMIDIGRTIERKCAQTPIMRTMSTVELPQRCRECRGPIVIIGGPHCGVGHTRIG